MSGIRHSRQLKRFELGHGVSARNRDTRGRRGSNNVNRVGVFTRPKEGRNRVGDNRVTLGNASHSRGRAFAYNCSDIGVVGRPAMRVPIIGTGQRNRLANRDRLFRNNGCRVDVCVAIARFGNSGGTIGASGSVARGDLALSRSRAALAGCDGVGRALVGLRLVGRSRNVILALRDIASGRDYLRCRGGLGLSGRLGDNLNGNV